MLGYNPPQTAREGHIVYSTCLIHNDRLYILLSVRNENILWWKLADSTTIFRKKKKNIEEAQKQPRQITWRHHNLMSKALACSWRTELFSRLNSRSGLFCKYLIFKLLITVAEFFLLRKQVLTQDLTDPINWHLLVPFSVVQRKRKMHDLT